MEKVTRRKRTFWTKEMCIAEANQYAFRSQWQYANQLSYLAALRNGWLEECCEHMIDIGVIIRAGQKFTPEHKGKITKSMFEVHAKRKADIELNELIAQVRENLN